MSYSIDIFIKSFRGDFKWLSYALRSVQMNVTGYNKLVLLVPNEDLELLTETITTFPERTKVVSVTEKSPGYLFQQCCKLNAHKYCDSDFIIYFDSDFFIDTLIDLQRVINAGKPEVLYTHYSKVESAIIWKEPTEKMLGLPVEYEMMRRLGQCVHRSTLVSISEMFPNLEDDVMSSELFSEFNFINAWSYNYDKEKYKWTNTDDWVYEPAMGVQIWSHSKEDGDELQRGQYLRTKEVIKQIFNEDI